MAACCAVSRLPRKGASARSFGFMVRLNLGAARRNRIPQHRCSNPRVPGDDNARGCDVGEFPIAHPGAGQVMSIALGRMALRALRPNVRCKRLARQGQSELTGLLGPGSEAR